MRPDWGVYVPVVASVFREVGLLCSLWYSTRWLPKRRWRVAALRDLLRFALNFTGARSVAYFNTKIAHFFIFPLLGSAAGLLCDRRTADVDAADPTGYHH